MIVFCWGFFWVNVLRRKVRFVPKLSARNTSFDRKTFRWCPILVSPSLFSHGTSSRSTLPPILPVSSRLGNKYQQKPHRKQVGGLWLITLNRNVVLFDTSLLQLQDLIAGNSPGVSSDGVVRQRNFSGAHPSRHVTRTFEALFHGRQCGKRWSIWSVVKFLVAIGIRWAGSLVDKGEGLQFSRRENSVTFSLFSILWSSKFMKSRHEKKHDVF